MLVKIGTLDITPYINQETYVMDETDVYTEWTDSKKLYHRKLKRKRVIGDIELAIIDKSTTAKFNQLLQAIQNNTTNLLTIMTVYVTNTGSTKTISAFLNVDTSQHIELPNGVKINKLKIGVREQ